jgi:hypothetical protein
VLRELSRVAGQQLDPKVVKTLEEMLRSEVARFGVPIDGFTAHNAVSDSRSRAA